ncbi:MAG: trans-sulfuration enzyme family protein [Anaerolineae bacterium]
MERDLKQEDILTHLGDDYDRFLGAIVPPIFQNSLFVQPKDGRDNKDCYGNNYAYTRGNNPTIEIAEQKVAALEGGEAARCFSSGMAAISSAILHWIEKDSHIITLKSIYGGTRAFLDSYLIKFGVEVTYLSGTDADEFEGAIRPNTKLIYLESPSSFIYSMQDLHKIAQIAKAHGIGTVIDNTYATPLHQNPICYGIDMVVHTASKYLGGHSDIVAGVAVGTDEAMRQIAANERMLLGANMDPHQAWLLIRGMRTLSIRLKQHELNAMKVAAFLESHPKVKKVFYPGLASHPQYELGKQQMSGYCGLMSIVPDGTKDGIMRFIRGLHYFQQGCSWGGFESLIIPIGVDMTDEELEKHDIPRNLVRIHVGIEHVDTLVEDLDSALKVL